MLDILKKQIKIQDLLDVNRMLLKQEPFYRTN